jgi:hypothetical protein
MAPIPKSNDPEERVSTVFSEDFSRVLEQLTSLLTDYTETPRPAQAPPKQPSAAEQRTELLTKLFRGALRDDDRSTLAHAVGEYRSEALGLRSAELATVYLDAALLTDKFGPARDALVTLSSLRRLSHAEHVVGGLIPFKFGHYEIAQRQLERACAGIKPMDCAPEALLALSSAAYVLGETATSYHQPLLAPVVRVERSRFLGALFFNEGQPARAADYFARASEQLQSAPTHERVDVLVALATAQRACGVRDWLLASEICLLEPSYTPASLEAALARSILPVPLYEQRANLYTTVLAPTRR